MSWHRAIFKAVVLSLVGFGLPVLILLPVEYAASEFSAPQEWSTVLLRYLPPAAGCSLLFLASSITSSTPRKIVTFVQSLFLHGVTFIVCVVAFVPIQHTKSELPHSNSWGWIPFAAVLAMFLSLIVIGNKSIPIKCSNPESVANSNPNRYDA